MRDFRGAIEESGRPYRYDAFLSFSGEDTRKGFTGHLHAALDQRGIAAFMDEEELRTGEEIAPALLEAIGDSRISIVVFSENYASSRWCLDELVRIVECRDTMGQIVRPVFYKVDPSDVRKQRGSYGQALIHHEDRLKSNGGDLEKVKRWREALTKAANISGWHLVDERESNVIRSIAKGVWNQLNRKQVHIPENVVAMDSHVDHMRTLLDMESNKVHMVGICGFGGIGKTTIAKATYNAFAHKFDCCSFLSNVRETCEKFTDLGLLRLQEALISQVMLDDDLKLGNVHRGMSMIKSRLCKKKVLIVIDDVNQLIQLETLAGGPHWFGPGSRIIVTTRDDHLLDAHRVKIIYKVEPLAYSTAHMLLSSIVFKDFSLPSDYEALFYNVLDYTKGLPLAIIVLGSFLRGRSLLEWKSTLDKLKRVFDGEIFSVLRISFDSLDEYEKDIFLDIACFFNGESEGYVRDILESCDLYPNVGIGVLIKKSLITIENGKLEMHDMIQEMGREIVRRESPKELGERSRLWSYEDVLHVLTEGTPYRSLKSINFSHSTLLSEIPDVSSLSNLESLDLQGCTNLVEVHQSLGRLAKVVYLNFLNCCNLSCFPSSLNSISLENLILRGCSKLSRFPDILVQTKHLRQLELHKTAIEELPSSFANLIVLERLYLTDCKNLKNLPCSIYTLQHLERALVGGCSQLSNFPECVRGSSDYTNFRLPLDLPRMMCLNLRRCSLSELSFLKNPHCMSSLKILDLSENKFVSLPTCISQFAELQKLLLTHCKQLREILALPPNITHLLAQGCESLETCADFSDILRFDSYWPLQIDFSSCHKLVEDQRSNNCNMLSIEKVLGQVRLDILYPGSRIPKWFVYQSIRGLIRFPVPSESCYHIAGLAFCAIFSSADQKGACISCAIQLFVDDQDSYDSADCFSLLKSDHIRILYVPRFMMRGLDKRRGLDGEVLNHARQFTVRFKASEGTLRSCGVHLVYRHG